MRSRWSLALLLSIPILIPISMAALAAAAADKAPRERRLQPSKVEASTFLRTRDNAFMENYHPSYVADDDPTTYWAVGIEAEEPKPQWLRLHVGPLAGTTAVRLRIQNGVQKPPKAFKAHGRAKSVTVKLLPSGVTKTVELADGRKWQEVRLEQSAGALEAVELEVTSIYAPGVPHAATSVTEVQVFAMSAEPAQPAEEKAQREALKKWRAERLAPKKLPWTAVSAGYDFTCGLKSDGTVACWGSNLNGQLEVPEGKYRQVAAGYSHACAVRVDSSLSCWGGRDFRRPLSVVSGPFSKVSAANGQTCALRPDGVPICWGYFEDIDISSSVSALIDVSTGGFHDCGLRPGRNLVCWGASEIGRQPPPPGKFKSVTSGFWHSCAIREDDHVICWASHKDNEDKDISYYGQADPPNMKFSSISAGHEHTCGLRVDTGAVVCWGAGTEQRWPGAPHEFSAEAPHFGQSFAPAGRFTQVSAGGYHTCALAPGGSIVCWGVGQSMEDFELDGQIEFGQSMPP